VPVERVQRYVQGIDLRSAINDNVAFKISFGLMFALASFGNFDTKRTYGRVPQTGNRVR
jgi:hypothetical protein